LLKSLRLEEDPILTIIVILFLYLEKAYEQKIADTIHFRCFLSVLLHSSIKCAGGLGKERDGFAVECIAEAKRGQHEGNDFNVDRQF
jgi:hypothetical protein